MRHPVERGGAASVRSQAVGYRWVVPTKSEDSKHEKCNSAFSTTHYVYPSSFPTTVPASLVPSLYVFSTKFILKLAFI